jgi:hypothetical protein
MLLKLLLYVIAAVAYLTIPPALAILAEKIFYPKKDYHG